MQTMLREGARPNYAFAPDGRVRLVAYSFPDVPESAVRTALEDAGAQIVTVMPVFQRYEIVAPEGRVFDISAADVVRYLRHADSAPQDDLSGLRADHQINEAQVAPYSLSGGDVLIGQVETDHPDDTHDDLAGRVIHLVPGGVSAHATHVAGIAAGDGTLSVAHGGSAMEWRGVAPAAGIVSWISSGPYLMDYGPAITMAEIGLSTNSWGASVSSGAGNCSIYGDYDFGAPEHDHIINGAAFGPAIPIFFSAGNERDDCDCSMSCTSPYINYTNIRPPGATAKNTLTVGAKPSDVSAIADFSSWGPMDDGRLKPEIVASGTETGGGIYAPLPPDTYGELSGTSMSTPAVAGAGALFLQEFRGLTATEPLPSTVKAHFIHSAADLAEGTSYLNVGPDYASGYGVLKVKDTIDVLRAGTWIEGAVDHGEAAGISFGVPPDASEVKVTLAWDDVAGAAAASVALVNDLELVVTDALGTRHFPWTLSPGSPSAAAVRTGEDHVNPLEQVFVDSAIEPGEWFIDVVGDLVPMGPQAFSVVWSHNGTDVPVSTPDIAVSGSLQTATLHPSHPNPFRPWTTIEYSLARTETVELRVLDVTGRVVRTLETNRRQNQGPYTYTWRGRDDAGRQVSSGVYLVELRTGTERRTRKVTLVR
ncbi:MAG: hypothetical protein DHS20C21_23810 [Gemmatimonadota bacterium]|nr:MAG: hypothetical protein DHS20C21_23810 [Gemmatimonadota bacterium]